MAGDRRPSKQMLTLVEALAAQAQQWHHGYDLMKETGLSSGTLYPLLMRMADQGLIEAEWREPTQPGRPPRHAYRLTAGGMAFARATANRGAAPPSKMALA
jgi:PadR family transcriptional regulator PadR